MREIKDKISRKRFGAVNLGFKNGSVGFPEAHLFLAYGYTPMTFVVNGR